MRYKVDCPNCDVMLWLSVDDGDEATVEGGGEKQPFRALVEQLCCDLNEAHNELLRAQGIDSKDFNRHDWPEWSPQANSIRWAEKLLKKRLAKTNAWTLYPSREE